MIKQLIAAVFLFGIIVAAGCIPKREPRIEYLPTVVPLATFTPSATHTPTATLTPTNTVTPTDTVIPTATLTPLPTLRPGVIPTVTLAPTLTPRVIDPSFDGLRAQIDKVQLMRNITALQNFYTRHANAMLNEDGRGTIAARDYLKEEIRLRAVDCASPVNLHEDSFTLDFGGEKTTQINLIGEVKGTNPNAGVIVIGAHYDTITGADPENYKDEEDIIYWQPGANDNAAGVVATLELMRLMCVAPHQKTFVFVLFAAEEPPPGRHGSIHFANSFIPSRGWDVTAMISPDTLGSATNEHGGLDEDFARIYSGDPVSCCSRQLARDIQAASYVQQPDFELIVEDTIDRPGRWGDHMSFENAGYPAVLVFEGSEDYVRQHSTRDILNDIDPTYLIKNISAILAYLLGASDGASPPQNLIVAETTVTWDPVSGAQGYLVVMRSPNQSGYHTMKQVSGNVVSLPPDTIFAVGTIDEDGLLGPLSEEDYIQPEPTAVPTPEPTEESTEESTEEPTEEPTEESTTEPDVQATLEPTSEPETQE